MSNMKAYTDINQSKKLAELQIGGNDMYYEPSAGFNTHPSEVRVGDIKYAHPSSVPCWSLAALLDVLPDEITDNNGISYTLNFEREYLQWQLYYHHCWKEDIETDFCYNMVDACYEMIIKLHELKLL